MAALTDDRLLTSIDIPGTHNSAAEIRNVNPLSVNYWAACQSKCIRHQLLIGIRFLDIRCSKIGNVFRIFHGNFDMGRTLTDVLNPIRDFLEQYPSETVLMRLRLIEADIHGTAQQNFQLFEQYRNHYGELFFEPGNIDILALTLQQIRGRVVLFQNDNLGNYFVWEDNNNISIQDDFNLYGDAKAMSILQGFNNCILDPNRLNITFASSAISCHHPHIQTSAEQNNRYAYSAKRNFNRVGIVVFDFPGDELICHIINNNVNGYGLNRFPENGAL